MAVNNENKQALRIEKNSMKRKYKNAKELRDIFLVLLALCIAASVYAFIDRAREREDSFAKQDAELYSIPVALNGEGNLSAMSYSFYFYRYYYDILDSEDFMVNYGAYGLDRTMPLRECLYTSQRNWYDRLSEETTTLLKETLRYNSIAAKEGTVIGDAEEKLVQEELAAMKAKAKKEGLGFEEYLSYRYCPGLTEGQVVTDLRRFYLAKKQYEITLEKISDFSKEELDAYYEENPLESLKGKENTPCVDIRMITLQDAAKAEEVYKKAITTPTEENFAKLVAENSTDDAIYYGGIYDDVVPGIMVANVDSWLFDQNRKKGDIQVFTENNVFCVIYYIDSGEESYLAYSRSKLYDQRVGEFYKKLEEDYPITENSATVDTVVLDYLATDYVSVPSVFSAFFIVTLSLSLIMLGGVVYAFVKVHKLKKKYGYAE